MERGKSVVTAQAEAKAYDTYPFHKLKKKRETTNKYNKLRFLSSPNINLALSFDYLRILFNSLM